MPPFIGKFGIDAKNGAEHNPQELRGSSLRLFLGLRNQALNAILSKFMNPAGNLGVSNEEGLKVQGQPQRSTALNRSPTTTRLMSTRATRNRLKLRQGRGGIWLAGIVQG
eukprot:5080522-Alexandrium_andersonii.AAC.1